MKQFLDRFILSFPTLFLKQYPYAWLAVVTLWQWPPVFSGMFLSVILIGILSIRWRSAAWISDMRRQYAPNNETFYVDRLPIPWRRAAQNLTILLAVSGLVAWLMKGQLDLSGWQWFIMMFGFAVFYMDTRFFGAETIYIITGSGIAIYYIPGHVDYRFFFHFKEIRQVQRVSGVKTIPSSWTVCSRLRNVPSGVLLTPRSPDGFSKRLQEIFLTPTHVDEFLQHIPSTLVNDL